MHSYFQKKTQLSRIEPYIFVPKGKYEFIYNHNIDDLYSYITKFGYNDIVMIGILINLVFLLKKKTNIKIFLNNIKYH